MEYLLRVECRAEENMKIKADWYISTYYFRWVKNCGFIVGAGRRVDKTRSQTANVFHFITEYR